MAFLANVFHLLSPPVFREDEEKTRSARTLNFILLVVLALLLIFAIPTMLTFTYELGSIIEIILIIWTIGMLILLRRGYVRQAAFLLSLTLWVVISYGTYISGGFHGSIMSSYYGIVLIAWLVLGTRVGIVFAFLSVGFTGWLVYADINSLLPAHSEYTAPSILWAEFAAVMIFVVLAIALLTSDLRKALALTRQDAKELHDAAVKAQVLAEKAEHANRFKDSLIHRISHELRNPLSIILPLSEMLGEQHYGALSDSQNGAVKRIFSNAVKLEKLIKELLDQSQIEAGHLKLDLATFSPTEMARAVHLDCITIAEKRDIELTLDIDEHTPQTILGDQERTEEILRNLVMNAIKYTEHGKVAIHVNSIDSEHWGFQVQDTGVGISKEAQEYIFDPFRQVDDSNSTKMRRGGVGLGLSIVRYLVVEAMGGKIDLVSEPGVGSTFTIVLPIDIPNDTVTEPGA